MNLTPFRRWLRDIAREAGERHFDRTSGLCLIPRDTCWYAASLLLGDSREERREGNRILRTIVAEDATHTPATMIGILLSVPDLLEPPTAGHLRSEVERQLVHAAGTEWRDGNVNHPLAAYNTLACGGAMSGRQWASDLAAQRLKKFADTIGGRQSRFRRQAEMSEYNSLTYSALDLWFLALTASHAGGEAAETALFLEQRLWVDVALRYHAPSGQFAGPHSRSYHEDSFGGYSALHCTMALALDIPMQLDPGLSVRFNHPSNLVQNGFLALLEFHPPAEARRIALDKPFPFLLRTTTYGESYHENNRRAGGGLPAQELCAAVAGRPVRLGVFDQADTGAPFAFDDEVYPGGWSDLTTYMTPTAALGSASSPYVNAGHADGVMLRVSRRVPVEDVKNVRSAWTRGVFNGALPGERNRCHVARTDIDESYLYEEGRCFTYQHRNRLIVCYAPKRAGHRGVTEFRMDLQFSWRVPFDELLVDGSPVRGFPRSVRPGSRLCWRDGEAYGLVIPFQPWPSPEEHPVILNTHRDFLLLSIWNHRGTKTDFSREDLSSWRTGCVLELSGAAESGSFAAFLRHAEKCEAREQEEAPGVRRVRYTTGSDVMEFVCDTRAERVVSRCWNGAEECVLHMDIEAGGSREGLFAPPSIFGPEARP